jgi:hypothetical protein
MRGRYGIRIMQTIRTYDLTLQQVMEHKLLLLSRDMQHATQTGCGLQPEVCVTLTVKCVHLHISLPPLYIG